MNANNQSEVLSLIHAARDGQWSAEQRCRLEAILAADETAFDVFVQHRLLEAQLELELAAAPVDVLADAIRDDEVAVSIPRERATRRTHFGKAAWAMAALALIAIGVGIWAVRPPDSRQPSVGVVQLEGDVFVLTAGGEPSRLQTNAGLFNGRSIRTGSEDSSATLQFDDGTTLQLNSASEVNVTVSPAGQKVLRLISGRMLADVAPQPHDKPLEIRTPHAEVKVVGTRLVSIASPTQTRVELEEGSAEFTRLSDGQSALVTAGRYADASSDGSAPDSPLTTHRLPRVLDTPSWSQDVRVNGMASLASKPELITVNHAVAAVWSPPLQQPLRELSLPVTHTRAISLSRDGRRLAVGGEELNAHVMDVASGKTIATFPSDRQGVRTIALSFDGRTLAFVDMDVNREQTLVKRCDVDRHQPLPTLLGEGGEVVSLAFSPDDRLLAAGTIHGRLLVWNLSDGSCTTIFPGHNRIRQVAFSPDGAYLASGDNRGSLRIWHTANWQTAMEIELAGRDLPALAFSPDSLQLAAGTQDGQVHVWRIADGEPVVTLHVAPRRAVRYVAFVSDGQSLATSCGWTGSLTLWAMEP